MPEIDTSTRHQAARTSRRHIVRTAVAHAAALPLARPTATRQAAHSESGTQNHQPETPGAPADRDLSPTWNPDTDPTNHDSVSRVEPDASGERASRRLGVGIHSGILVGHPDRQGVSCTRDNWFELGEYVAVTADMPLSGGPDGTITFQVATVTQRITVQGRDANGQVLGSLELASIPEA